MNEVLARPDEKPALAALMREYIAEMTALTGEPSIDAYPFFDLYWTEPNHRWPYWIKADGSKVGFAFVRTIPGDQRFEVAEFFVARSHRRRGIGLSSARRLISRHPGAWRITQREVNTGAIAFWHRVLDGFVAYDEATHVTDVARREQRFAVP